MISVEQFPYELIEASLFDVWMHDMSSHSGSFGGIELRRISIAFPDLWQWEDVTSNAVSKDIHSFYVPISWKFSLKGTDNLFNYKPRGSTSIRQNGKIHTFEWWNNENLIPDMERFEVSAYF